MLTTQMLRDHLYGKGVVTGRELWLKMNDLPLQLLAVCDF